MKKLRFFLCLTVGVAAFIWLVKVPLLSSYLSSQLHAPVFIEWASIWPSHAALRHFTIQDTLKLNEVKLNYQLKKVLGNPSVIDQIVCDGGVLYHDRSKSRFLTDSGSVCGDLESPSSRAFVIEKFIVRNLSIQRENGDIQQIDRLEFDDIESVHGFPIELLIQKIEESPF